jgi:hypothetical protein
MGYAVEVGQREGGCGMVRKGDKASGQLVACLSVRVVVKYGRPSLPTVGGEAGGQTQAGEETAAAVVVDGPVGLSEEVFDGITSILKLREEEQKTRKMTTRLTEVSSLPGSPNDDLQEISSRPRGRTVPGACCTGMFGGLISLRM